MMNRREANRIAKEVYCSSGELYLDYGCWQNYIEINGWSEKEANLIFDYYERTTSRVRDWLNV